VVPILSSELLSGLPSSLTDLTIAGFDCLTTIRPNTFKNLPGLEWLNLQANSLKEVQPGAFNHLNNL
jgi:hypothetical protein